MIAFAMSNHFCFCCLWYEHGRQLFSVPPSGELIPNPNDSDDDDNDDLRDDFDKEVEATFLRAVLENIQENHLTLEVNSLKLSYNKVAADCAGALFYAMMKYAVDMPHSSAD